jgi:hypothetical protein
MEEQRFFHNSEKHGKKINATWEMKKMEIVNMGVYNF